MFQATGNMMIPMFLQAIGAVTNIILDPILIFGINGYLKLGVAGAAIATVIGQMTACILAIFYLEKINFKISLNKFKTQSTNYQKYLFNCYPLRSNDCITIYFSCSIK